MDDDIKVLSGRDQILKRPQMWVGSMDPISKESFIIKNDRESYEELTYIPAFRKIIDEILDNAVDILVKKKNSTGVIKVEIDDESVSISDDGPGMKVEKKVLSEEELKSLPKYEAKEITNSYIPELAWTRLFTGSNFDDSVDRKEMGAHGLGAKCTSIFSTKFIGKTDDGKNSCTVTAINNLEKTKCKISDSSGKTGTTVKFWPDLTRFNLSKIDDVYKDVTYQRLVCLSVSFPNIKFYFNKQMIKMTDKKFMSLFSDFTVSKTFENGFICVFPNEFDDFKYFTYVDGLNLSRGGTHIDYIANQLVSIMRDKLEKSCKNIKPADIKNKISLVAFLRNFPNMKYDSQTKETLSNSTPEISTFLSSIDFEKFAKDILKCKEIVDPIVDMFKLKQELKTKSELKKVKKIKVSSDKYMPPMGNNKKYLMLCEGLSARSGISASLGRDGIGYYAMKGLPINGYSSSLQKLAANQEFKEIFNLLEIDISSAKDTASDISMAYDSVVITSDADADGDHITAMLIGWMYRFAPNLFKENKVKKLVTPVIITVDKNDNLVDFFFTVNDFKKWEAKHPNNKNKIDYKKGLGSWDKEHLIELIEKNGIDMFVQDIILDENSDKYIDDWLGDDSEPRKEHLRNYKFDINNV